MKFNALFIATTVAFASVSVANAADQGSGKVTFTGSIIDAPCSVASESVDQTVPMGQISNGLLAKQGQSGMHPFSIELKDCSIGTKKGVTVTFTGTPDPVDATLLALSGTATGAGIVIYDNLRSKPVTLGTATDSQTLAKGDNSLKFAAYLKGSSKDGAVVPGDFTSVANFTLAYL